MPAATGPVALWVLWLVFWLSCVKRVPAMPVYAAPAALMLVAAVWRVKAQRAQRQTACLTRAG
jgi:low temperature requirement protein LtrA